jgi:magnesium-transporting ATPase (P-type)
MSILLLGSRVLFLSPIHLCSHFVSLSSAAILATGTFAFVVETRAEKMMEGLSVLTSCQRRLCLISLGAGFKQLMASKATVMRDGQLTLLDAEEIVPGCVLFLSPSVFFLLISGFFLLSDVVHVSNGNLIPADMRIVKTEDAKVNMATLTGLSS